MNPAISGDQSTPLRGAFATAKQPIALTIAGFDPSSGAGVTADLKVFAAFGIYGMSCITGLTVQSTQGVRRVQSIAAEWVQDTLEMLHQDVDLGGIKIGMLTTAAALGKVSSFLRSTQLPRNRVVLDPVLQSSSGRALIDQNGIERMREELIRDVGWITPNLEELSILSGLPAGDREAVPEAAARLQDLARSAGNPELNVLVTGGHLETPEEYLLEATGESVWIPGEWVETNATHGTGCAFSSALLCARMQGQSGPEAAATAKAYVAGAMRAAYPVGKGRGPMHHLFQLAQRKI